MESWHRAQDATACCACTSQRNDIVSTQQTADKTHTAATTHKAGVQPQDWPAVSPLLQQFCAMRPKHAGRSLAAATALAAAGGGAGGLHCAAMDLASACAAAAAPPKPCAVATAEASAAANYKCEQHGKRQYVVAYRHVSSKRCANVCKLQLHPRDSKAKTMRVHSSSQCCCSTS